jgi:hypothetical protein
MYDTDETTDQNLNQTGIHQTTGWITQASHSLYIHF